MVQVIPQSFLPVVLGLIKYKIRGPERLPLLCGDTATRSAFHNTSHIQPFICTRSLLPMYFGLEGPILDAESNILETTFTRVLSQEMASLQHSLPGPCGIVDLLGCGYLDTFLGLIEYEVYDSSCLNDWASKQWSELP